MTVKAIREVPFFRPHIVGTELEYVTEVISNGQISSDGHFTKRCSQLLEESFDIPCVLLTPSCTASLEMAAILAGVGPGDEVVMPSFTFVSTASAFVRLGARPAFVDICPKTLNIDVDRIEAAITAKTKAIVPVHYAGVSCDMENIRRVARRHGLMVIEDAAQGVNAQWRGHFLGSLGQLAAYSFHTTKNFVCGEGGALCVNDEALIDRAHIIREKGTNRRQFELGQVEKYTWVDIGSSYVPSEISSAFLLAQLEQMDNVNNRRERLDARYRQLLQPLVDDRFLRLPSIPTDCSSNYHLFYVLINQGFCRAKLIQFLRDHGVQATFHYVPLHVSPVGASFGYQRGDFPVTESVSSQLVRLPFFDDLQPEDQEYVVATMRQFFHSCT
ncbi:MAG: dTDP-4-amino-4,6-dideoxygalactose transaminase [Pirellulaceae bacterium]|nr:dTDP-4-amino-4,6-dideoxygalactose transaminase [Planctomycetales bacterium]